MDDITSEASPDYLGITATIDKSGAEPIVNVDVDLFKDITNIDVKVSLLAKIAGDFREIYPVKDFNPCKDEVEDEFVKYAMDQIENFGNLTITCPFKAVIISSLEIQSGALSSGERPVRRARFCLKKD